MDPAPASARSRRAGPWVLGSIAVTCVVAYVASQLWVSAFGSENRGMLDAIKRDPMTSYVPPGAATERRSESAPGTAMGMASSGGVMRTFIIDRRTRVTTLRAVRDAAERTGWKIESSEYDTSADRRNHFRAHKDGASAERLLSGSDGTPAGGIPDLHLWSGLIERRTQDGAPYPPGKIGLQLHVTT